MGKTNSVYYDDDGRTGYRVLVNDGWIGYPVHPWGTDSSWPDWPPLPSGIRMRSVTCVNSVGQHRAIPIQNPVTWQNISYGQVFAMPTNDGGYQNWSVIGKKAQSYQPKKYVRHRRRS